MKKKIIAIISVIAIVSSIFCIQSFAFTDEDIGKPYVENGDLITWNSSIVSSTRIEFNIQNTNPYSHTPLLKFVLTSSNKLQYFTMNGTMFEAYTGTAWNTSEYRYMTILQDSILTEQQATALQNNSDYVIKRVPEPPIPPVYEGALENTNAMFGTTLSVMTVIITWLLANQIALCGLYLYILIACIGIGKRFVKT